MTIIMGFSSKGRANNQRVVISNGLIILWHQKVFLAIIARVIEKWQVKNSSFLY